MSDNSEIKAEIKAGTESGRESGREVMSSTNGFKQKIIITDRKLLEVQGVLKVEDFDKQEIHLETVLGNLIIHGGDLHIAHLLLEAEQLVVSGEIKALSFDEDCCLKPKHKKSGSFLQRLTK